MGVFSWCTSDTKKSIAVDMYGYSGSPKKVYLLNPFGEPYEENNYEGYGVFAGQDVFALVAKWNAPEKCKDKKGNWLQDDDIRTIGIHLACYDEDHVQLKYPIKIVEKPTSYEEARISPSCPYQGYFYPDDVDEIRDEVDYVFFCLDAAMVAYQDFLRCDGEEEEFLKKLNFDSHDSTDRSFIKITAKHPNTPEKVFLELVKKGDIYVKQELARNKALTSEVLSALEKTEINEYIERNIKTHPNYKKKISSLDSKITNAESEISPKEQLTGRNKDIERDV